MAWISIHQSILGGKLRELHKDIGCSRNEALGILGGLWLWGIDNTTAEGLLRGCGKEDIIEQLCIGLDKRYEAESVYDALISGGWLEEREEGIYIHDWEEWREHYNRWQREKALNKERQKRFRERHAEDRAAESVQVEQYKENIQSNVHESKKDERYPAEGFNVFWKAYPRKNDKGQAYRKYKARIKDGYRPEELIAAAEAYARECKRRRTEPEYIKHAKTFLGDSTPFTEYMPNNEEQEQKREPGANPFL